LDCQTIQKVILWFSQCFVILILIFTTAKTAASFNSFVRVFILSCETVFLNKVHCSTGHTSVTSHISVSDSCTIN
jgi:hypothetical protein